MPNGKISPNLVTLHKLQGIQNETLCCKNHKSVLKGQNKGKADK